MLAAAFAFGAAAQSAIGWRVFAIGTDQGEYGAIASAAADVRNPTALAFRSSQAGNANWSLICFGERAAKANEVVRVAIGGKCHLDVSISTQNQAPVRLQLLRR